MINGFGDAAALEKLPQETAAVHGMRLAPSNVGSGAAPGDVKEAAAQMAQQKASRIASSRATLFILSARLARNTKIVPENGSCPSASRTSATGAFSDFTEIDRLGRDQHRIPAGTVIM
jgi:hypothetical protein